ncbi:MAG: TetR/AcrR family transcriptional regulator [Gammaproteobacteria bacterium]|nr:TetR/AcrR family transcriptional regulator [Gammaproteobacteria bacterium]
MARPSEKRNRLVFAAKELIHKHGYKQTSLADIAKSSNVPLGNVYYYFRTKQDIALAVVSLHREEFTQSIEELNGSTESPLQRVFHYITGLYKDRTILERHGCPLAKLCMEVGNDQTPLSEAVKKINQDIRDWYVKQLEECGVKDSTIVADEILVTTQGAALISATFSDRTIFQNQIDRLLAHLRDLVGTHLVYEK